ncbi:MAG TPA: SRPBCC domain-containing protein [Pedobacter sp.]|nr:SRPBCC domain-containing protein [Pedobacter sp.]
MRTTQDYTISFLVSQTPKEVFRAVNDVRGWWSEQIEGRTDQLNEVFNYHYQDVHRSRMKIIEFIPDKKVVWLVEDNYFNFIKDQSEWKNTKISFEMVGKADQTELVFTHIGLVPADECYDICSDAWGNYIGGSLKDLITKGKGNPNPYQAAIDSAGKKKDADGEMTSYSATFLIDKSPATVFNAIGEVSKWWSPDFTGTSKSTGDAFEVNFGDIHYSKHQVVESIPFKRIIWLVTDSKLSFLKDQKEWTGTKNIFEITTESGKTRLTFTHQGLQPQLECFKDCTRGWQRYIDGSLLPYILTGKGSPGL